MKHIPLPTYDLQSSIKTSPDRVDAIIRRMQDALQRNSNPTSFGGRNQNFRLTQGDLSVLCEEILIKTFPGFLLSSTQQVLDKWSAQVRLGLVNCITILNQYLRSRIPFMPWRRTTSEYFSDGKFGLEISSEN